MGIALRQLVADDLAVLSADSTRVTGPVYWQVVDKGRAALPERRWRDS